MSLDDGLEAGRDSGVPPIEPQKITDPRMMRALAHPVRIALLEALGLGGPMTATEIGERIGETPTTCSFHLRQLAKYGWVEEAGGGKGRARPWRMSTIGFQLSATHDDPETDIAARALSGLVRERQLDRYRRWVETRATYPKEWQEASDDSEYVFYLTAAELAELSKQVHELLMARFRDGRLTDPSLRPPGSVPVEMLTFAYPMEPPPRADQPGAEGSGGRVEEGREALGAEDGGAPGAAKGER